jgi:hypothetical protein
MCTIGAADMFGLPVSTTHVLSSGVAGTMVANGSGMKRTLINLLMAWVLTLPAAMVLAGSLYWLLNQIFSLKQNLWERVYPRMRWRMPTVFAGKPAPQVQQCPSTGDFQATLNGRPFEEAGQHPLHLLNSSKPTRSRAL